MKHQFPEKLMFLFHPARYKVAHGGRGGAKSWGFARALLMQGASRKLRILCAREIQNSIAESVHKLLKDQIEAMGMEADYEVQNNIIRGKNGTEIIFEGLRHNIQKIKSMEGIDIGWVEEAQTVSKTSWDVLIPTIRKTGSEIWVSFNPELESDETYKRMVLNPPPGAVVVRVNWMDNPWFPDELRVEKDHLRGHDYDSYLTVWEGHCRHTLDGAIYAAELRRAMEQGRICSVPYDPSKPVHTFWDLGWRDLTSIWFAQSSGFQYRVIDFHQDSQRTVAHYLKVLQDRGYVYGWDYLPHDAESGTLASEGRGVDQLMRAAGRRVRIVPRVPRKMIGINAARTIFDMCVFDEARCADGLQSLRRYRYEVNKETGQMSREPMHDENSHAADGFQTLALSIRGDSPGGPSPSKHAAAKTPQFLHRPSPASWMGA